MSAIAAIHCEARRAGIRCSGVRWSPVRDNRSPRVRATLQREPEVIGGPVYGPDGGLGPVAIAKSYDQPVQYGFDGTGHAAGVTIDVDSSDRDLAAFTRYFRIQRTGRTHHIPVDGGTPCGGGADESTLDTETIGSYAPGADLYAYNFGIQFTNQNIIDGYEQVVDDNKVDVDSSSFGFCENDVPRSFLRTIDQITMQGAARGISFVASTGDFGRGGKCNDRRGQDTPAVNKFFTSVGGTELSVDSNGNRISEIGWGSGGGGASDFIPLPPYQRGLGGNGDHCISRMHRNIPDIASSAVNDSFYYMGWVGPIAGASWSAPTVAAFIVEADDLQRRRLQRLSRHHARNQLLPSAYGL